MKLYLHIYFLSFYSFIQLYYFQQSIIITGEFLRTSAATTIDIGKWQIQNAIYDYKSQCSSFYLFGGYNFFSPDTIIQRFFTTSTYFNTHIFLGFAAIDDWSNQYLQIYLNNDLKAEFTFPIIDQPDFADVQLDSITATSFSAPTTGKAKFYDYYAIGYFLYDTNHLCGSSLFRDSYYLFGIYIRPTMTSFTLKLIINCKMPICTGAWGINNAYYFKGTNINAMCAPDCIRCASSICRKCPLGLYMKDMFCVTDCGIGYILNTVTLGCVKNGCIDSTKYFYSLTKDCFDICPSKYFANIETKKCQSCSGSCLECFGPLLNNCISCNSKLLYKNECFVECPIGTYKNVDICIDCHPNCYKCNSNLITGCIECMDSYLTISNQCVKSCSLGYFANNITKKCEICDISCKTCNGSSGSNCLSCTNLYLYNNQCYDVCPSFTYPVILSNEYFCFNCHDTCNTCNGPNRNNCVSCKYLEFLEENTCVKTCSINYFKNLGEYICEKCVFPCLACSINSKHECLTCQPSYLLIESNNTCIRECSVNNSCDSEKLINIFNSLNNIHNPNSFLFCFWGFENTIDTNLIEIIKNININITNYEKKDFEYKFLYSNINQSCFSLNNDYKKLIIKNKYYLELEMKNIVYESYFFKEFFYSILLNEENECSQSEYLNTATNNCEIQLNNNYKWKYSDNSNIIIIIFDYMYSPLDIYINSNNFFYIYIDGYLNQIDYNYTFEQIKNEFSLIFSFNKKIIGTVFLKISVNQSTLSNLNIFNATINVQNNNFSIKLMQNYLLDESTQLMINESQKASELGALVTNCLVFIHFVINPGSSFVVRGILSVDIIQLLKYLNINYPQNLNEIFKKPFSKIFISRDVIENNSNDNYPQLLILYQISSSIINNIIEELVIFALVLILGFVVSFISNYFNSEDVIKIKGNFFKRALLYFYRIIVWNTVIGLFISKYFRMSFFLFISLRFLSLSTSIDTINLIISLIVFIYVIWLPYFSLNILSIYRQSSLMKNKNKIIPLDKFDNETKININPIKTDNNKIIDNSSLKNDIIITENKDEISENIKSNQNTKQNENFTLPSNQLIEENFNNSPNKQTGSNSRDENFGLSPPKQFGLNFKNLKVVADKKIYKLTNKKIWDVTPLSNIDKKITIPESKKTTEKKILNNITEFLKNIIMTPFICLKNLFFINMKDDNELSKYSVLYRDLKECPGIHNYYFCFELIRYFLLPFSAIMLYGFQMAQISLMICFNFFFFVFLIITNPFKSKFSWILAILKEIGINLAFISTFALTILDTQNDLDDQLRLNLGWIVIFSYLFLLYTIIFDTLIFVGKRSLIIGRMVIRKINLKLKSKRQIS